MLESFWLNTAVAALTGILSALGVGGGSLMMLWLTAVRDLAPAQAAVLNYLYFLPCGILACLLRKPSGSGCKHILISAIIAGAVGAVAGNLLRDLISALWLRKILGIFFLISGFREIRYRESELR